MIRVIIPRFYHSACSHYQFMYDTLLLEPVLRGLVTSSHYRVTGRGPVNSSVYLRRFSSCSPLTGVTGRFWGKIYVTTLRWQKNAIKFSNGSLAATS